MKYIEPPDWDNDDGIFDPDLGELADHIKSVSPPATPLTAMLIQLHDAAALTSRAGGFIRKEGR